MMNIMVQMQAQVEKVEQITVANKKELKEELVQVNAKVAALAARPTNPQMGLWCRYSYLAC